MRELPKGWILVEFDELFNFVIGGDWGKDPKILMIQITQKHSVFEGVR